VAVGEEENDASMPSPRIEFERGGMRFTVHVPDVVELRIEVDGPRRRSWPRGA